MFHYESILKSLLIRPLTVLVIAAVVLLGSSESALADRVVTFAFNGISILGTSHESRYCTVWTQGTQTVSCESAIPLGNTPEQIAQIVLADILNCAPPGVISVVRIGFQVQAVIADDADALGFECMDIPDIITTGGISGPYTGPPSKAKASVTVAHFIVADGDRTCRTTHWTVKNVGSSQFPANAEITWLPANLTHCAGVINTGGQAGNLNVGQSVGPFLIGYKITTDKDGVLERGTAFPRPNFDPSLDDPELTPVALEEQIPVPTVSEWGLIVMLLLALTAGTIVFARRRKPVVA